MISIILTYHLHSCKNNPSHSGVDNGDIRPSHRHMISHYYIHYSKIQSTVHEIYCPPTSPQWSGYVPIEENRVYFNAFIFKSEVDMNGNVVQ